MRWIRRIDPYKGCLALFYTLLLAVVFVFALGWHVIIIPYGTVTIPYMFISDVEPAWSDGAWYASMCCCVGPTYLALLGVIWRFLYAVIAVLEKWFFS